jgi:hypothetical protein
MYHQPMQSAFMNKITTSLLAFDGFNAPFSSDEFPPKLVGALL